jgi:serine protease Do
MNFIKKIFFTVLIININFTSATKAVPASFADLAEKLMPSVVYISTTQTVKTSGRQFPFEFPPGSPFGEMFKEFDKERQTERKASALGSGFIIKESGIVITNNHVIKGAEDILVKIGTKEYKAKVIGADPYMDIAVLKMETEEKFKAVKFGDSDKARVGDWVVAIGNPFGLGGTVTSGIISARNRDINLTRYDDFIQTDASINQGNSGGPLFNLEGEVIGINTAIIAPGKSGSIGIGFAIPANAASNVIDQLIDYGETRRGWLGVRIQEVTKEIAEIEKLKKPEGALVASVGEKSPADKAGIKAGDIILDFDGKKIDTTRTLQKFVANTKVGKIVQLKIWRNKKLISKKLTLGRLESSEEFKEKKLKTETPKTTEIEVLKITVRDLNKEDISLRKLKSTTKGVVITNISNKSPLAGLLNVNDIIIEAQKTIINKSSDLNEIVNKVKKRGDKNLLLSIINKNSRREYLGIKIN